tara:strand:+ start:10964 stop:11842 length:879 start_codon:yes stop_codon:yes gene_type:complete
MEKTKIWVIANWPEIYDPSVGMRCFRNWPDNNRFELSKDDHEYLIVLGGFRGNDMSVYKDKEKTIGFLLEPRWSANWQRDLDKYCKYVVAQEADMFEGDNIIEYPLFMLTQSTDWHHFYLNSNFPKFRRMSIVISNYGGKPLERERLELFKALLATDLDIDFYGRNWNVNDSRYKGAPYNKSDALVNYEYSIAIENCRQKNYLTEKFFDLTACNTVPLYYGCPNVADIYPAQSFIELDFSGPIEKTVEQVREIYEKDDYSARLPHVLEAKQLYYTKYNIFDFLQHMIDEKKI